MKSFKEFRRALTETTVPPELRHIPESWEHHLNVSPETKDKINKAVGPAGHTSFPLSTIADVDPDPDVVEHLNAHGYHVKDYIKGIATTKKRVGNEDAGFKDKYVDERIGSVLEKTKAPLHVKSAFMNDAGRQATKTTGHHVCITTTPVGIAGMSVGTAWAKHSCMNLESGAFKDSLKHDSTEGTHVAYLVSPHDAGAKLGEPDHPLARIALKPFHANNNPSETIFRAEDKVWGAESSHFKNAVDHWAKTNYPASHDVTYEKNRKIYDDTGLRQIKHTSNEQLTSMMNMHSHVPEHIARTLSSSNLDHIIKHAQQHYDPASIEMEKFIRNTATIPHLNNQHVSKLASMATGEDKKYTFDILARYHGDKFSTNNINKFVGQLTNLNLIPQKILMSSKLPDDVVDAMPADKYQYVRADKIKPNHIDKIVDRYVNGESGNFGALSNVFDRASEANVADVASRKGVHLMYNQPTLLTSNQHFNRAMHDQILNAAKEQRNPNVVENLFTHSKFTTAKDIAENPNARLYTTLKNKHIADSEMPAIKDILVNSNEQFLDVPAKISQHMTDADYTKMARDGRYHTFENKEHSNKFLDKNHEQVVKADQAISDQVATGNPEGIDQRYEDLKQTAKVYSGNMEDHMVKHVIPRNDEGERYIADHNEFDAMNERLDKLDDLKHYASKFRGHHDEYVTDLKRRLAIAKKGSAL